MKITRLLVAFALCLGISGFNNLQAQDMAKADTVTLKKVLKTNRHPISYNAEGLTKEGGQWLRQQAKEATIVTLGETHLSQDIPAMITALIKDLQQAHEFDHLAIEVSPWTTELMAERLQKGKEAYDELIKKYPYAIPFYNFRTERDLLHQAVTGSDAQQPLWGLDQIFAFSTNMALDRLEELAPTQQVRVAINKIRKTGLSKSADHPQLQKLPQAAPIPISVYRPVTFDTLRTHFQQIEEAQQILTELSKSVKIYRLNDTDNYVSNQIRGRYLRDNLQSSLKHAQPKSKENPQIVIKVGAMHAYRGMTPNNVLDVGNLSVALARAMGGEAFNVAIMCGPGSKMASFPAQTTDCWPSRMGSSFKELSKEQAVLFDLTSVHPKLHKGVLNPKKKLEKFLWAFDAVVLIPDAQPAVPIVPLGDE